MRHILSRDAILAANDIKTEEVEVPEWGGLVLVRGMTGLERDAFEATVVDASNKVARVNLKNFRAKFVACVAVDADGQRLFDEADAIALGEKSAAALQRVFNVGQRLSGLSDEDVNELIKKSESDQNEDSGSS